MIGQILPNNNERCYSNFSPTFREVNTPFVILRLVMQKSLLIFCLIHRKITLELDKQWQDITLDYDYAL
jgi:hypothetical protein